MYCCHLLPIKTYDFFLFFNKEKSPEQFSQLIRTLPPLGDVSLKPVSCVISNTVPFDVHTAKLPDLKARNTNQDIESALDCDTGELCFDHLVVLHFYNYYVDLYEHQGTLSLQCHCSLESHPTVWGGVKWGGVCVLWIEKNALSSATCAVTLNPVKG